MFADHTLTPKEATRLCVLGTLAVEAGPMHYRDLATRVRHFVDRVLGPSIDLMGPSIELLKYEGLIAPVAGQGLTDDAAFILTDDGRRVLKTLLTASIRNQATDLNKLIVALKFRFLHLLEPIDRLLQADMLVDCYEAELARLDDLRQTFQDGAQDGAAGFLPLWLDHDIDQVGERLAWLRRFRDDIARHTDATR